MRLPVKWISRWVACSICQGWPRARWSFPRAEAPRRARSSCLERGGVGLLYEGMSTTLERGGDVVDRWRPRRGGLERGGDRSTGSRGPRMGRTVELGHEPSMYWASLGTWRGSGVLWKSWRSSMVSGCRATTELSSLVASSSPGSPLGGPFSLLDRRKIVWLDSP